jgi:hypothetical protein
MAGGLTVNGVAFRTADRRIFFDLYRGLHDGLIIVGEDDDLPEAAGMVAQPRRAVGRSLELRGWVQGVGATLNDRRADFDAAMGEVWDALDPTTGTPYPVVVTGPYLGVPTGETRTLQCRYFGDETADPDPDWARRVMVVELFSVQSPPYWVVGP